MGTAIMAVLAAAFLLSSGSLRRQPVASAARPVANASAAPSASADEEKKLQEAVDRNPKDVDARIGLARVYLKRRNLKQAWKETREALRVAPGDARALTYEGVIELAAGEPEAAVISLKAAIEKNPDFVEPRLQLAYAYVRLGLSADADATIAAATKRFPNKSDSILRLASKMRQQVAEDRRVPGVNEADPSLAAEEERAVR